MLKGFLAKITDGSTVTICDTCNKLIIEARSRSNGSLIGSLILTKLSTVPSHSPIFN